MVSNTNRFVFAYSDQSQAGPIRYNEIRGLCEQIGVCVITATGMRHRVSTAFWRMDIFEEDIECFMEQVGHNWKTDTNIYACVGVKRKGF